MFPQAPAPTSPPGPSPPQPQLSKPAPVPMPPKPPKPPNVPPAKELLLKLDELTLPADTRPVAAPAACAEAAGMLAATSRAINITATAYADILPVPILKSSPTLGVSAIVDK